MTTRPTGRRTESLFDNRYRYDYIFPRGRSGETLRAYDILDQDRPVVIIGRRGAKRVGVPLTKIKLFGLGQPLADGLKFIFKEEATPRHVDKILFTLAPISILAAALAIYAVIPFGSVLPKDGVPGIDHQINLIVAPGIDVGMIYIFALSSIAVYGVILGGWASNSKYSLLGGLRSSAQLIAYELPMGLAIVGVVVVSATAWWVGSAVRHNIGVVEPLEESGDLDELTRRLDRLGDGVIVVAYVISVALYLRIMAEYVFDYVGWGGTPAEKVLASLAVALIVTIGVIRGFAGLERLDEITVGAVVVLTAVLGATLLAKDVQTHVRGGLDLPPVPEASSWHVLLVLGGIVITVQGFETVRYLKDEYDARTRIWASRVAQLIAASMYLGFVAVATPVMGLGTDDGADRTLLDITSRVAPWLALPLVLSAVLSQFSAAVADTAAADGNLRTLSSWFNGARSYLVSGVAAIALAAMSRGEHLG